MAFTLVISRSRAANLQGGTEKLAGEEYRVPQALHAADWRQEARPAAPAT